MDEEMPHIEVRAIHVNDAPALHALDYNFETDRIYTLCVQNRLMQDSDEAGDNNRPVFAFELLEKQVDPPIYKNLREGEETLAAMEEKIRSVEGGYVALADGEVAGAILLRVEEWRSVTLIQDIIVGHQYRRYGIGSLLLNCAADWARKRDCWAIILETQNINYPAIQFYLRNGLEVWSINPHFYPPGPSAHEVAILMGKRLSTSNDGN
jgi:GNAT superfamily N-acetyltransferase